LKDTDPDWVCQEVARLVVLAQSQAELSSMHKNPSIRTTKEKEFVETSR
jgi:hypothetical protein